MKTPVYDLQPQKPLRNLKDYFAAPYTLELGHSCSLKLLFPSWLMSVVRSAVVNKSKRRS